MPDPQRPRVLVYRNDLLERSETFIAAQTGALRRFDPVYCGLKRRANGFLQIGSTAIVLADEQGAAAKLRRMIYLETGIAPRWGRTIAAQQASLLHAHFAVDAACALPLVKRLKIPLVVTLHGYDVTSEDVALRLSRGGRVYLRRRQALFEQTHTFLCVSEFIRAQAARAGYPASKLWVHPIGIDLSTYRSMERDDCGPQKKDPLVLFVGRLVEKKGCVYLLRAMRTVQQHVPEARLVVIGEGTLKTGLERTAGELGLSHYSFLGSQPGRVVRKWLGKARVFSVPSIVAANGDAEGLGMVFCEAQAMGVPVVSFATGGIPEAVADGKSGFLVREKDEAALALRIVWLLKDDLLWQQMRQHGRERMAERFDLKKQTAILEAKYDRVLMDQRVADWSSEARGTVLARQTSHGTAMFPASGRSERLGPR